MRLLSNEIVVDHNSLHASDVVQSVSVLLAAEPFVNLLSPLEKLACLIAAAVHDCDHPGTNNHFQTATRSPLALLYNDRAVLENHHLATAFNIFHSEGCNFLEHLGPGDQDDFRHLVIDLVMATDFSAHFTIISTFNTKVGCVLASSDH